MKTIRIVQKDDEKKGRAFTASLLGWAIADALWPGGSVCSNTTRPVWMSLLGSDAELRAVVANLQAGRKAEVLHADGNPSRHDARIEFLRSERFSVAWQRTPEGTRATLYHPELLRRDPGMIDPSGIAFVVLPEPGWLARPSGSARKIDHDADWADVEAVAPVFARWLDCRTRCPILPQPAFHAELLLACMDAGIARVERARRYTSANPLGFMVRSEQEIDLGPCVAFRAGHPTFQAVLSQETARFLEAA